MEFYYKGTQYSTGGDSDILTEHAYDPYNLYDGTYNVGCHNSNGTVNTAKTACWMSDFIDVSGKVGKTVTTGYIGAFVKNPWTKVTAFSKEYFDYCFYGSDKSTVVSINNTAGTSTFTVPSGAKYLRISWTNNSQRRISSQFFIYVADAEVTDPNLYFEDGIEARYVKPENVSFVDEPWTHGKTWVMFGDSHVDAYYGKGWQSKAPLLAYQYDYTTTNVLRTYYKGDLVLYNDIVYRAKVTNSEATFDASKWELAERPYCVGTRVARELGLTMDNRGHSGTNLDDGPNPATSSPTGVNAIDAFIAEVDAGTTDVPDIITISFGTNGYASHIGTSADTSATTTTAYGAMKYVIEKLREKCPNSAVGFILPPKVEWSAGTSGRDPEGYRNAMLAVLQSDEYQMPYIDLWTVSGITKEMEWYGNGDGIHPFKTEQLRNLYYHALRRFMMGL